MESNIIRNINYSNETIISYDKCACIHQLIEKQVKCSKNNIAVECLNESITYKELNEKANQIAWNLRKKGIHRDDIVALMCNRSIDMIVGMLGILKAGACYLPIDPKYPLKRIQYILEDSRARVIVTQKVFLTSLDSDNECVCIDSLVIKQEGKYNIPNINMSTDLAYIIYTSGSTGMPKGVMLTHQSVHNFIVGVTDIINFTSKKTIVSLTTISFDIFVLESLLPLVLGMKIIIADPMQLLHFVEDKKIDMLQTTPSTMKIILNDEANLPYIEELSEIMLGGEAFPLSLLKALQKMTKAKIYNMYGPTETTVWSTIKDLTEVDKITIGKPISNTEIYILDENNTVVENGEIGELGIAGDGLARGYLNREELTKERFIYGDFGEKKRLYKTGDLAKRLDNNDIEYCGRIDSQVKIRGFRIELGEIEACLSKYNDITDCVIIGLENNVQEKYLVAYYVAEKEIPVSKLIHFLKQSLPEYMIPGVYMKISNLPMTSNYKIDKNALPKPDVNRPFMDVEYVKPGNTLEESLTELWCKILNKNHIGIYDNFFELGGNSILLTNLTIELQKIFGDIINVVDIFASSSIAELAKLIHKKLNNGDKRDANFIILPKQYYLNGINDTYMKKCSVKLPEKYQQEFSELQQKDMFYRKSAWKVFFMYLLRIITEMEVIILYEQNDKTSSYRRCMLDFGKISSKRSLLENLMKNVIEEKIITDTEFLNIVLYEKDLKVTYLYNVKQKDRKCDKRELSLLVNDYSGITEFEIYFDSVFLNENEIANLLSMYVELIPLILKES